MSKRMGRPPVAAEDRKSERVQLVLTPKIKQAIDSRAQNQDVSVSTVIRAALAAYLNGTEDQIQ